MQLNIVNIALAALSIAAISFSGQKPSVTESEDIAGTWVLQKNDKTAAMLRKSLGSYYVFLSLNSDKSYELVVYPGLTETKVFTLNVWKGTFTLPPHSARPRGRFTNAQSVAALYSCEWHAYGC